MLTSDLTMMLGMLLLPSQDIGRSACEDGRTGTACVRQGRPVAGVSVLQQIQSGLACRHVGCRRQRVPHPIVSNKSGAVGMDGELQMVPFGTRTQASAWRWREERHTYK